jgi:hypothetical protein
MRSFFITKPSQSSTRGTEVAAMSTLAAQFRETESPDKTYTLWVTSLET